MGGAPKRDRVSTGLWVDRSAIEEAERIADEAGLMKSQVLRLAIEVGLPILAARFAPPVVPNEAAS